MIKKKNNMIVEFLIKYGFINEKEADICNLAISQLITNSINLLVLIIMGTYMNIMNGSIAFFIMFMSLRVYAGGFHAKTEKRCLIYSHFIILCANFSIKFIDFYANYILLIASFCTICIAIYAPVEAKSKPLSKHEYIKYGKIAKKIVSSQYLVAVICVITGYMEEQ